MDQIIQKRHARTIASHRWEDAEHPLYEIEVNGKRLAVIHPGVGAPMAAGILEETIALGCRKFIACGGAGMLNKEIAGTDSALHQAVPYPRRPSRFVIQYLHFYPA